MPEKQIYGQDRFTIPETTPDDFLHWLALYVHSSFGSPSGELILTTESSFIKVHLPLHPRTLSNAWDLTYSGEPYHENAGQKTYEMVVLLLARIIVQRLNRGSIEVQTTCYHPSFQHVYTDFREQIRLHWLNEPSSPTSSDATRPQYPSGRERFAEDNWALIEVRVKKRKPAEVFPAWQDLVLELNPTRIRGNSASTAQQLFYQAIKTSKLKREKPES